MNSVCFKNVYLAEQLVACLVTMNVAITHQKKMLYSILNSGHMQIFFQGRCFTICMQAVMPCKP